MKSQKSTSKDGVLSGARKAEASLEERDDVERLDVLIPGELVPASKPDVNLPKDLVLNIETKGERSKVQGSSKSNARARRATKKQ